MTTQRTTGARVTDRLERFRVEPWVDWLGATVTRWPGIWRGLGNFEARRFAAVLAEIEIVAPIFICGLARSGSTILLESLAAHTDAATHRYRDYPGVLAPIFWERVSKNLYRRRQAPAERAHGDGIVVTPDSPEAVEEMLWLAFYPHVHDPARDNRFNGCDASPEFSEFYREHIRKILWLRDGRRYVSKGNYNLARIGGLRALFPDARFIVPVRDPVTHVASLMRQQALFSAAETRFPAALRYMQSIGHFEFGLDRRPLNLAGAARMAEISELWREGREIAGWSLYWSTVYDFVAETRENPALGESMLIVRFEDLCRDPSASLDRIFAHARLPVTEALIETLASRIHAPAGPAVALDDRERDEIRRRTRETARNYGY